MANERIEAEVTVPSGVTVGATTAAGGATVTLTPGTYFPSTLCTQFATDLNAQRSPYPQSATEARAAGGTLGTFTAGWLFNEASGNLQPVFGTPALTPVSSPTYGATGWLGGTDKAIGFDSALDAFSAGDAFDVTAVDDLICVLVCKCSSNSTDSDWVTKGWNPNPGYIVTKTAGQVLFQLRDGATAPFVNVSTQVGNYMVLAFAVDRGAGKIAAGSASIANPAGTISTGSANETLGNLSNAVDFIVGSSPASIGVADQNLKISAMYIGVGVGAAASVFTNISAFVQNWCSAIAGAWSVDLSLTSGLVTIDATNSYSLTFTSTTLRDFLGHTANIVGSSSGVTGPNQCKGLWIPGCNLVADSDPLQAPRGDDGRATISPDGSVYGLGTTTYFRSRNVRFSHVAQSRVWANSATTVGADWETFYLETQRGQGAWFSPFARVKVYWDYAGTPTELGNGDVTAWKMPKPTKLDDIRLAAAPWTGLFEINLGDLYASG